MRRTLGAGSFVVRWLVLLALSAALVAVPLVGVRRSTCRTHRVAQRTWSFELPGRSPPRQCRRQRNEYAYQVLLDYVGLR